MSHTITDRRAETGCYCPSDCTCHDPYRLTLCGCTGKHAPKVSIR